MTSVECGSGVAIFKHRGHSVKSGEAQGLRSKRGHLPGLIRCRWTGSILSAGLEGGCGRAEQVGPCAELCGLGPVPQVLCVRPQRCRWPYSQTHPDSAVPRRLVLALDRLPVMVSVRSSPCFPRETPDSCLSALPPPRCWDTLRASPGLGPLLGGTVRPGAGTVSSASPGALLLQRLSGTTG